VTRKTLTSSALAFRCGRVRSACVEEHVGEVPVPGDGPWRTHFLIGFTTEYGTEHKAAVAVVVRPPHIVWYRRQLAQEASNRRPPEEREEAARSADARGFQPSGSQATSSQKRTIGGFHPGSPCRVSGVGEAFLQVVHAADDVRAFRRVSPCGRVHRTAFRRTELASASSTAPLSLPARVGWLVLPPAKLLHRFVRVRRPSVRQEGRSPSSRRASSTAHRIGRRVAPSPPRKGRRPVSAPACR
jgi:hypothetical protein